MKRYIIIATAATLIIIGVVLEMSMGNMMGAGDFSCRFFSAGIFSCGVFSAGIFSAGIFSIGIFSIGIFSMGIFNIGLFATGLFVIAWKKRYPVWGFGKGASDQA